MSVLLDKYRPTKLSEIIGNEKVISEMINWVLGDKRQRLLVFGSSGIGKRLSVNLLIKEHCLNATFIDCSDLSKSTIELIENTENSFFVKNKVIVFENLDSIKGYSVPVLSEITKVPAIFIGNKLLSKLSKKKYKCLCFGKILKKEIEPFFNNIIKTENLKVSQKQLKEIINSNPDIRSTVLLLENGIDVSSKKLENTDNSFSVKKIFSEDIQLQDINRYITEHPKYLRLLIQENYLKQNLDVSRNCEIAELFSFLDITDIYSEDNYIEFILNKLLVSKGSKSSSSITISSPYISTMSARILKNEIILEQFKETRVTCLELDYLKIIKPDSF
jgi:hypothetical protein